MALTIQQIQDRITAGYDQRDIINLLADYIQANMPLTPIAVKEYVAILYQTGTDNPVAHVLKNTLGGTPVWTREDPGIYYITLIGAFPMNKTTAIVAQIAQGNLNTMYANEDNNVLVLETDVGTTPTDAQLYNTTVEIKVYQ